MSYPTVTKAIEGFLLSLSAGGRSKYTLRNYKNQLGRFADWIDDIPIDEVTSKQLDEFMRYLSDDFRITQHSS